MKRLPIAIVFALATQLAPSLHAQDNILDLTALANYAAQTKPAYITKSNTPGTNPITDAGATLGRVLFYDKRLSRNDTVSCSSCHQQARAFGDAAIASTGVSGTTTRHTTRVINPRFGTETHFFWDERATSLENQATQPIQNQVEMGFSGTSGDPTFSDLVLKLAAIPEYRVLFTLAFGTATIDETKVQRALAQFMRSIQSFDSKYDSGRATTGDNTPFPNFTAGENAGKQLFLNPPGPNGAGCAACHRPPEFDIDPNSLSNGIVAAIGGGTDTTNTRSPSLRDLIGPAGESNGPFMHNGAFATLAQVVNHYNAIPANTGNLDPRLRNQNLNLTQAQKDNLVAFMQTLTGTSVYTAEKWASPFSATSSLTLAVMSPAGARVQKNANGTATLTCKVAPGLQYQLQSSTDLLTWTTQGNLTPDVSG
ncbi:MAG: cytochrome-c peroxidase, partial [Verrucomicrobiota bacterium]|nr:cytochrome-c peroxidase [Verrucomicrobiota bacterium]